MVLAWKEFLPEFREQQKAGRTDKGILKAAAVNAGGKALEGRRLALAGNGDLIFAWYRQGFLDLASGQ